MIGKRIKNDIFLYNIKEIIQCPVESAGQGLLSRLTLFADHEYDGKKNKCCAA